MSGFIRNVSSTLSGLITQALKHFRRDSVATAAQKVNVPSTPVKTPATSSTPTATAPPVVAAANLRTAAKPTITPQYKPNDKFDDAQNTMLKDCYEISLKVLNHRYPTAGFANDAERIAFIQKGPIILTESAKHYMKISNELEQLKEKPSKTEGDTEYIRHLEQYQKSFRSNNNALTEAITKARTRSTNNILYL